MVSIRSKSIYPFLLGGKPREAGRDIAELNTCNFVIIGVARVSLVVCEMPIFAEPLRGSSTEHIQHMHGINLGQMYQQLIDFG